MWAAVDRSTPSLREASCTPMPYRMPSDTCTVTHATPHGTRTLATRCALTTRRTQHTHTDTHRRTQMHTRSSPIQRPQPAHTMQTMAQRGSCCRAQRTWRHWCRLTVLACRRCSSDTASAGTPKTTAAMDLYTSPALPSRLNRVHICASVTAQRRTVRSSSTSQEQPPQQRRQQQHQRQR
jgi:hypothetical protein